MAQPFILLSPARSGSTAVRTELDRHPDIACMGEILSPEQVIGHAQRADGEPPAERRQRRAADPAAYLRGELDLAGQSVRLAGFKLLFQQFGDAGALMSLDDIRTALPDAKVLLLWRRDLLARYRSEYLYLRKHRPRHYWMHAHALLDPEYIRLNCEWQRTKRVQVHTAFGERSLEVAYEDILADPGARYDEIARFLGVDPFPEAPRQTTAQGTKRAPFIDKMMRWHRLQPFR